MGVLGLYLRLRIAETPGFLAVQRAGAVARFPLAVALRQQLGGILTAIGVTCLQAAAFYLLFVYSTTYLSTVRGFPLSSALLLNTAGMVVICLLIPVFGRLSDRLGRKPQQIAGACAYLLLGYPLFRVLSQGSLLACGLAHGAFAVIHAAVCSATPAMFVEMFPARVRYSSVSLAYNLALAVFGGWTPLLAAFLIRRTGNPVAPSYYLLLSAAVTLVTLLRAPETRGRTGE